jgi:hypothetical protein
LLLLLAFVLGSLMTLMGRYYLPWIKRLQQKFRDSVSDDGMFEESLKILYPHMGEHPEVEEMVRKLYVYREKKFIQIDKVLLKRMVEYYKEKGENAL